MKRSFRWMTQYRALSLFVLTLLLLTPLAFWAAAKNTTRAPETARPAPMLVPTHARAAVSAPRTTTPGMVAFNIKPFLTCVEFDPETKAITAYFGYESFEAGIVQVPVGIDNNFFPNPLDRGQPILFYPGLHERAFRITAFEAMVWNFSGFRVGASVSSSPCGCK